MKNISEVVQKIESHYVGDDCVQVMVPYQNSLTILSQDNITYFHKEGTYASINKYIEDERRKQFPYSNIPTHYSRFKLFRKINHTNQLFDFEKPYIQFRDGGIVESFAIKDQNEALLINKLLNGNKREIYVSREELEELFSNSTGKKGKFIIPLDDENENINIEEVQPLESEESICSSVKSCMKKQIEKKIKYDTDNFFSGIFLVFTKQNFRT